MPCFADIVLKCNKRIGKLILSDLIARFGKPRGRRAWRIDKRAMRRAADIAFEPFAYFDYYRCGESAPYALLSLNYSAGEYSLEDGKLWIANVVPATKSELDNDEYNHIVKQFHDEILFPLVKSKWPELTLELLMPKKRVVAHPTRSRGIMQHMYFDFIIGEDSEGKERRYTCNPNELGNSVFGKNVGAPQFLTAVYFKTAVLDKYLDSPSRYDVEAGCLRCKGVNGADWCIPIDNHGTRCVSVWLGDLGGLPYDEQLHFASYNVARGTMSEIYLRSQIDAEFCDSNNIIQIFKAEYRKLYDTYADQLEWVVILPLAEADRHCLNSLKLLTCDEQKEFDEQILSLTKVLVDSINEKKLKDYGCVVKANGGINLLEAVVESVGMIGYERHIKFLRNLQDLRSACVAHRKGSRYEQMASRVGLNVKTKTKVFCEMIEGAVDFCRFMRSNVCLFRNGCALVGHEERR